VKCKWFFPLKYIQQPAAAQATANVAVDVCLELEFQLLLHLIFVRVVTLEFLSSFKDLVTVYYVIDRLCGLVIRVPDYRSRGPGPIPSATTFPEK
jgi:hypothetical protein